MRSGLLENAQCGDGTTLARFRSMTFQMLPSVMVIGLAWLTCASAHGQGFVVPKSGPPSGEKLFGQQCGTCHSSVPGEVRVGPSLAGIVGRTAGKSPGFTYSRALRASRLTWSEETLNLWLANSNAEIPGSVMNYRQSDAAKRLAIIEYLKRLRDK